MSDEESFVILGTSPMPSILMAENHLNNDDRTDGLIGESPKFKSLSNNNSHNSMNASSSSNSSSNFSIVQKSIKTNEGDKVSPAPSIQNYLHHSQSLETDQVTPKLTISLKEDGNSINSNESEPQAPGKPLPGSTLAANFLMGEVDSNVLKESIYSQFPSICSNESNPEDIVKLQCLMYEYVELKETVRKTNATITKYFQADQKRQVNFKHMEDEYKTKMSELEQMISKLRNENLELKSELESRMDHIALNDELMRKDNFDLVKLVSEKSALIENMRAQIQKLEQKDLSFFEYVQKTNAEHNNEKEYVPQYEHKAIIADLNEKLRAIAAENLENKYTQSKYVEQINRLRKDLNEVEELLKKTQADISLLQRDNLNKESVYENCSKKIQNLEQEVGLLTAQVDIYRKDFEMERAARESLATEKNGLLNDLKMLQRRNQQMIEEAQARLEQSTLKSQNPKSVSPVKSTPVKTSPVVPLPVLQVDEYLCPLCDRAFKTVYEIQMHVNSCLDD